MNKADVKRFEDLASADETVRVEAARELYYYDRGYFDRPERYRFSDEQINALLAAWHATSSDLVRIWIANGFAFTETERDDILPVMVDSLAFNGPYVEWIAQFLYTRHSRLPDGARVLRSMHQHPDSGVRWRSAMFLRGLSYRNALDRTIDIPILRQLMLDSGTASIDAVQAMSNLDGLDRSDYEALLDVVNTSNGASRHYALELMAKLEKTRPDCAPATFAPRIPNLRTDGIYHASREELDHEGIWVSSACLRFFDDGSVHGFGTNEAPADFADRLPRLNRCDAQGSVIKTGGKIAFSLTGAMGTTDYNGEVDGTQLHLVSTHSATGKRIEETYHWTEVDWHAPLIEPVPLPARLLKKKQVPLPFTPVRPKSMRASEAAKWYLQMLCRLPMLIAQEEDEAKRATLAWQIKDQMRNTAAAAMYDPALKKEFFAKLPLPALEEIQSLSPADAIGRLMTITKAEVRAFPGTVGEAIGLEYHLKGQVWVMTEAGWALKG